MSKRLKKEVIIEEIQKRFPQMTQDKAWEVWDHIGKIIVTNIAKGERVPIRYKGRTAFVLGIAKIKPRTIGGSANGAKVGESFRMTANTTEFLQEELKKCSH